MQARLCPTLREYLFTLPHGCEWGAAGGEGHGQGGKAIRPLNNALQVMRRIYCRLFSVVEERTSAPADHHALFYPTVFVAEITDLSVNHRLPIC